MKITGKVCLADGWETFDRDCSDSEEFEILELAREYERKDESYTYTKSEHLLRAAQAVCGRQLIPGAATHGNRVIESVEQ